MRPTRKIFFLLALVALSSAQAQIGWKFEYITSATSHWKHLGSGDTIAIARLTFSQTDQVSYRLTQYRIRPLTNHPSRWFVEKLQLWKDNGDNKFNPANDTLVIANLNPAQIPTQATPQYILSGNPNNLLLQNGRYLFITAVVTNWHDSNPENIEIDETSSGPQGVWFSVVDSLSDFTISPTPPQASLNNYTIQRFDIVALNLPVMIRNPQPSAAEDDSSKLNMFFPKWEALNRSNSSRVQRLTDQEFWADVFLPITPTRGNYKIESVEFDFGFDNTIISLDSVALSDWWGIPASFFVNDTLYFSDSTVTAPTNHTLWHFRAELKNSAADTTTARLINQNSLLRLRLKVIKPGISPIYLKNIVIRDHYGIRYHPYQVLQNYADAIFSPVSGRYDAWAKFVLGDFTYPYSKSARADNPNLGDGQVTWEDITFLAQHIWLNPSFSEWYNRFDIASTYSHDPDELMPDDTTDFFDLLQLTKNYYRTLHNAFAQKVSVVSEIPIRINFENRAFDSEKWICAINLTTSQPLIAVHLQIQFDPQQANFLSVAPAEWLKANHPQLLLIYPDKLSSQGILDLNLVVLDTPIIENGDWLNLEFSTHDFNAPNITIEAADFRNLALESLSFEITNDANNVSLPTNYLLLHNYPNPFNATTLITYAIPENQAGRVSLAVYDLLGKRVKTLIDQKRAPGSYQFIWDGTNEKGVLVGSGVYFLGLKTEWQTIFRKVILLR